MEFRQWEFPGPGIKGIPVGIPSSLVAIPGYFGNSRGYFDIRDFRFTFRFRFIGNERHILRKAGNMLLVD